jgi:hypothetical protein
LNSSEEVEAERRTVFSMLEEFEGQPPFTIQRLSELVLRPTEHHHTLPKYISALKRLLSVTATRDAFPDNVGEEEMNSMAKLVKQVPEGFAGQSGLENQGNGYRYTTSMPGSPATAPLFSPIPFLMRPGDEGLPGRGGSDDDGMIEDGDIPGMELGGADRTSESAVEMAKRSGAGAGTGLTSGRTTTSESNGSSSSVGSSSSSTSIESDKAMPVARPASEVEAALNPGNTHLDQNNSNVTNAGNGPRSNEPLGVPSGMVDELDQLGQRHGQLPPVESGALAGGAKALTSTTTSTATKEEDLNVNIEDDDSLRAIKRVRSERNLPGLEGYESKE